MLGFTPWLDAQDAGAMFSKYDEAVLRRIDRVFGSATTRYVAAVCAIWETAS
jgi:hypothetical protein